jgi:AraC-like DNA-binding protein
VVAYIRKIYKIYEEKSLGYELQLQSIFYQLIYIWITEYRWNEIEPEVIKANRKLERLGYITAHIRENYREDLSLEGLAKTFGYSPTYLSKMFRRYAQMNYKDYIQNVRLEYACQELEHTDNSIAEIAVNNGFANGKAMAKAFRKKYGQLPSQFKRQKAKEKE